MFLLLLVSVVVIKTSEIFFNRKFYKGVLLYKYMKKTNNITTQTNPQKILELFRDAGSNTVNLKTSNGFIYLTGEILSKLEDNQHYIAQKGRWVKI